MKKLSQYLIASLVALMTLCSQAFAQAALTYTTTSAAVADSKTQTIPLASVTGMTARTTQIYIDKELMDVNVVNTASVSVRRGAAGTMATAHASGSIVYAGPANYFSSFDRSVGSYCSSTTELVLPVINVKSGKTFDCQRSVWEEGTQVNVATVSLSLRVSHHIVSINYAGVVNTGSVSVVAQRGLAQIGSTTTLASGYVYGSEGKARLDGTMTGGWVFGTIGQLDISNATLTSGSHLGGLWSDAGATGPAVSCTFCDGLVVTNTTATTFNSAFYVYSKAGYLFDLSNNGSAFINGSTGTSGSVTGYLKIKINGSDAYIAYKGTPGT